MSDGKASGKPAMDRSEIAIHAAGRDGPPILLLHGFGADRLSWTANVATLEAQGRVLTLDLPGHGASLAAVGDGSVHDVADGVATALDRHGPGPMHVVGHSLGGAVALMLAQARPDLVASLALIAPAGLGDALDAEFLADFPELETPEAAEALLQRLVVRPRLIGRAMVSHVLAGLDRPGARDALRSVAAGVPAGLAAIEDAATGIAAGSLPRLVVWGEEDRINALDRGKLLAFGGETHILPATGHLPHVESAAAVNRLVAAFVGRQMERPAG